MKKTWILLLLVLTVPLVFAQAPETPAAAPAVPATTPTELKADAKLDTLAVDLKAILRIAELSKDIDQNRQVLQSMIDSDLEALREPRGDGTYKWAALQREEGSRKSQEKAIEKVSSEAALNTADVAADNGFRLLVTVPAKRNLIGKNNKVYIRKAVVDATTFDGKVTKTELPVDVWVNPGDTHTVALPDIYKSVKATVELGVESGTKKAAAEVSVLQAKLVDDAQSPYFPAVRRLLRLQALVNEKNIRRGELKTAGDEAVLAMPGELQKRMQEQAAATAERKALVEAGTLKNAIAVGDATPDVLRKLDDVSRLMAGTADEQAEARKQMSELLLQLKPQPVTPPAPVQ